MSGPAYLPLFPADYLADTQHLSTEEHGAYLLLMMTAWMQDDCTLPDDDRKLARITRLSLRQWKAMRETMLDFWSVSGGRWVNRRLSKERVYADKKSQANRENARKRWDAQAIENKQSEECERISDGYAPQPQPHNISTNVDIYPPTPRENPSEDPGEEPRSKSVWHAAPEWVPEADWTAFLQHRREARRQVTNESAKRLVSTLTKLRDAGNDPARVLNQSIERGWIGLFPLDEGHNHERRDQTQPEQPRNPVVRAALERKAERAAAERG